jgi:hypothetical protein
MGFATVVVDIPKVYTFPVPPLEVVLAAVFIGAVLILIQTAGFAVDDKDVGVNDDCVPSPNVYPFTTGGG